MQTTKADALYAGADLHGNNVFLSLCDVEGNNVFRRRVKANLGAVNAALEPFWKRIVAFGVESTFNWYWLVDGLREQGRNVKLGNPAKMEQYEGIKITNDLTDAGWLAEQLRLGIFPESYIYPKQTRPVRDALRRRQLFVRRRTQVLLSFGGLLERYGLDAPGARKMEQWTLKDIQATGLDGFVQLQLETLLDAIHESDRLAKKIEKQVLAFTKPTEQYQRTQLVPGIGISLGMLIVLESGDFKRFASAGDYASYCRAVKRRYRGQPAHCVIFCFSSFRTSSTSLLRADKARDKLAREPIFRRSAIQTPVTVVDFFINQATACFSGRLFFIPNRSDSLNRNSDNARCNNRSASASSCAFLCSPRRLSVRSGN
ncbi:hypothetical protein PDESU_01606 [Pontiella desulfatans]|uniref:Transposase IS110-like N-terminal domain-containing protein n=1 Tax=Pontiella desulfatans TaxID=2750659 RepID=A0A6C2TZF8_PONDE|nr:hypothetical protein PDESU_01606 [Pontiella desulfatans]